MRIQADPQVRCEEQKNALRNKVRSADVTVSRRAEAAGRRRSEGGGLRRDAGFWELCCGGQQRLSLPSPWKTEGISKSATALLAVGDTPAPRWADSAALAAWTCVANTLLNFDETITRE